MFVFLLVLPISRRLIHLFVYVLVLFVDCSLSSCYSYHYLSSSSFVLLLLCLLCFVLRGRGDLGCVKRRGGRFVLLLFLLFCARSIAEGLVGFGVVQVGKGLDFTDIASPNRVSEEEGRGVNRVRGNLGNLGTFENIYIKSALEGS